jgi:hypothetical protein
MGMYLLGFGFAARIKVTSPASDLQSPYCSDGDDKQVNINGGWGTYPTSGTSFKTNRANHETWFALFGL